MISAYPNLSGQTVEWLDTDNKVAYARNKKLTNFVDSPISYSINSNGFRCPEFTNNPCAVFLGCSHTVGIGVNVEDTFGYQVSLALGLDYVNLGMGGGSAGTMFRFASYWLERLNHKLIVMLVPSKERFEIIDVDKVNVLSPNRHRSYEYFYRRWTHNELNTKLDTEKNVLAIKQLAGDTIVKTLYADKDLIEVQCDLGRDMQHCGVETHRHLAEKVLHE